jgi:RNA polymerase sigma-70 factor (ECF subfamily)
VSTPRPKPLAPNEASSPESRPLPPQAPRIKRDVLPVHAVPTQLIRVDERAEIERVLLSLLPKVRLWLHRLLGPRGPIDDATQDTLIALASGLKSFEGRSSLQTYAHRITVRVAYRYYARSQTRALHDPDDQPSTGPTPEAALQRDEVLERLHRCLAKLPARRRTAFVLCAIEGLTPQEAAELEGTSAGSMRSRYLHAREELSRMLATLRDPGGAP